MSFCRNCGAQMIEGAAFCIKCGTADLAVTPYKEPAPSATKKCGFGYGISSMILGIFGLFLNFILLIECTAVYTNDPTSSISMLFFFCGMPLLALIFSIVSIKGGRNNGFSKTGLITGIIGIVFAFITLALIIVSFWIYRNPIYYF